jgi:hypothetical protein
MRTHSFNGQRFEIFTAPLDGLCDIPKDRNLELHIFADLKTRNGLITVIHEALHAENENWTEAYVDRVSKDIGRFLWRLGFRKTKKEE